MVTIIYCILDSKVDGQLGVDGDKSLVPYLVKMAISDDGSVTKNEKTPKVGTNIYPSFNP